MAVSSYLQKYMPNANIGVVNTNSAPTQSPTSNAPLGSVPSNSNRPLGFLNVYKKNDAGKFQVVKQHASTLNQKQLQAALNSKLNKRPTVKPTTPVDPTKTDEYGYYFNPYSKTLWGRRYKDAAGNLVNENEATLNSSNVDEIDFSKDAGLPSGLDPRDALFFLQRTGAVNELENQLRPFGSQLDKLGKVDPATGKRVFGQFDLLKRQAEDASRLQGDQLMSSLAQRGLYDSGMRGITGGELVKQLSSQVSDLNDSWGAGAESDLLRQQSDAQRNFGNGLIQQLLSLLNRNESSQIVGA